MIKWKSSQINNFQKDLLSWYHENKKALPWRKSSDPYRIWISEIMSQQTQVETVIPYYEKFLQKYPTISDLSQAEDAELLKLWEGLGYYSRARNLKLAAGQVMSDFNGVFPEEIEDIRSLRGIGPYSAASISSICFNLPEPAIDGNLFRVTSRLFEISDDISKASTRKVFDEILRQLISQTEPGNFNQALMDLGATICKPKSPKCELCPLSSYCQSYEKQSQENFPVKSKKLKQVQLHFQAFVLQVDDQYLMTQRPPEGLLASMWTFPMLEVQESAELKLPRDKNLFPIELESQIVKLQEIGEVSHIFSHQKWKITVILCQLESQVLEASPSLYNQKWLSREELKAHALAGPQVKIFKLLTESGR